MCAGGCVGDGEWQGNPILSTDRVLQDLIGILSAQVEPPGRRKLKSLAMAHVY